MIPLLRNLILIILLTLSLSSTLVYAQTAPKTEPLDQTNIIFPGCRLSSLLKDGDKTQTGVALTPEQLSKETNISDSGRTKFVKSCIQEIIRFVIILASLAAILKIAVTGLALLDPTGSKIGSNMSSAKTIQNLVIGLFLLVVGWNIIPILNTSFNNTDFLSLPGIEHCKVANANCSSPESDQAKASKLALDTYIESEKKTSYGGNEEAKKKVLKDIKGYCDNKDKPAFKDAFANAGLDTADNKKVCQTSEADRAANLDKWAKKKADDVSGPGADIADKKPLAFYIELGTYVTARTKNAGKAAEDLKPIQKSITEKCTADALKDVKSTTDLGKKMIEDCKKINDPKTVDAFFKDYK
jgi:hypothetical protein